MEENVRHHTIVCRDLLLGRTYPLLLPNCGRFLPVNIARREFSLLANMPSSSYELPVETFAAFPRLSWGLRSRPPLLSRKVKIREVETICSLFTLRLHKPQLPFSYLAVLCQVDVNSDFSWARKKTASPRNVNRTLCSQPHKKRC